MKKLSALVLSLLISASIFAQIETPMPSPTATISQDIGLTETTIVYSRPGVKDRKIFGDLVPYGEMWRTGANMSTKITFGDEVQINDQNVPAGTYALYTIPGKEEWTIIIHKNISYGGTGGDSYTTDEDLMRFTVKPSSLEDMVETFTIDISNNKMDRSTIDLSWENTRVSFEVLAPVDEKITKMIDRTLNPGGTPYYRAATYYHESGKDLNVALGYVNTAIEKYTAEGSKPFWVARRKALIQADLGKYKEAIKSAEQSTVWATEAKNDSYVKMNEESIAMWKKK
ncbi:DUF2911 domain-containing protein [Hyphobacterium sp. CCMP332]|nr:DUF2911 domain-containing protein [Hyphobacterium sp. CCMP332]